MVPEAVAKKDSADPRLSAFDYLLPSELIAKRPPAKRDGGRLLVQNGEAWADHRVRQIPTFLRSGDLLVLNDTRVMAARLFARRKSGGLIELLLLETGANPVQAMVRPARRLRIGEVLQLCEPNGAIRAGWTAEITAELPDGARMIRLNPTPMAVMAEIGAMPLPPYMERPADRDDAHRYQTVFANELGAVAAPTAGLHLSTSLLTSLADKGVRQAYITLHVGPGTFRNLRTKDLDRGALHPERYRVPSSTVAAIAETRRAGGRIVAVGTTVTRALESAALTGGLVKEGAAQTRLFIRGGYRFQVVNALLTNFHLPRSSLLMLVCAFGGRKQVLEGYGHAVQARYRFFSYGDAMFLTRGAGR
jgi:S-adenosylmethionine:tRNA ribosyltransferase-isomerase